MIEKVEVSSEIFFERQERAREWQRKMKEAFRKREAERKVALLEEIRRIDADRIAEELSIAAMYRQHKITGRKARREFRRKMKGEMFDV